MNVKMPSRLADQLVMVEAVTHLFHPYVEGVIHDLCSGRIVAIYNALSRRQVGDSSVIAELSVPTDQFPDFFEPYYKTNWDGRKLKCVSVTVRDQERHPIGLICLNFDTTVFGDVIEGLSTLLKVNREGNQNPVEAFTENWQQHIDDFLDAYLIEQSVALSALTKTQKQDLVIDMYDHGLFNFRGAASFVARRLSVSRATVYNYLKAEKTREKR